MNKKTRTNNVGQGRLKAKKNSAGEAETASERVARLYRAEGGALVGWLVDEARRRGMAMQDMANEVGVTVGYISQLRTGRRPVENVSRDFVRGCAEFLGVAPVMVMLVAGCIRSRDFNLPRVDEEELLDRALQAALADPRLGVAFPEELLSLSPDAKRALISMYSALSGQDPMGFSQLPESVRWLQRACACHDANVIDGSAGS